MTIRCEIVSQDRIVFQDKVDIVVLPGEDGEMGILPDHSPVLTILQLGVITVRSEGSEHFFTVSGGVAEIQPDQVTVLADAAEDVEQIDLQRAEAARKRAEELLEKEPDGPDYLAIQAALLRSRLRLDAVRRFRRHTKPYQSID